MVIDEMERRLRPPELELAPYPPKTIVLASGERLVVREASRDETGTLLETIHPLMNVKRDFYDIVAARMYAEILGWYRYRVANEFVLVGSIDGEIAGIVNSRLWDERTGISLHTLAVKRGLRVGALLFASKMEHHIEFLGQEEVHIVAESPIGFKRWMIEYALENRSSSYPALQHELGGVPTFTLTRDLYFRVKESKLAGTRPPLESDVEAASVLRAPERYAQIPGYKRSQQ